MEKKKADRPDVRDNVAYADPARAFVSPPSRDRNRKDYQIATERTLPVNKQTNTDTDAHGLPVDVEAEYLD